MLMEALKPWINWDHEGVVEPGRRFQASSLRATELENAGLAVPVLDENEQIKVVADAPSPPPPQPAKPPPPTPSPQPKAHPQHDTKPVSKGRRR
jgi:outer membrane biosynthesis protein TonB